MPIRKGIAIFLGGLVSAVAGGAAAQATDASSGAVSRAVELPGHRALAATAAQPGTRLSPFETDGCSGGLSDVWRLVADQIPDFSDAHETAPPWEECCVVHDRAYHGAAGKVLDPEAGFAARLIADRTLETCVIATGAARRDHLAQRYDVQPDQVDAAYSTIAGAMYLAVRFGGGPCTGLPWRWGFGYPSCSVFGSGKD